MREHVVHSVCVTILIGITACTVDTQEDAVSADEVYASLLEQGLSCEVIKKSKSLTAVQWGELHGMIKNDYTDEEFMQMVQNHEDCASEGFRSNPYDSWDYEDIENLNVGGGWTYVSYWYTDYTFWNPNASQYEDICEIDGGNGDYVWFFELDYAWQFQEYLRWEGNGGWGNCIAAWYNDNAARVYGGNLADPTDDDVRMCVGYTAAQWCFVQGPMHSASITFGFQ